MEKIKKPSILIINSLDPTKGSAIGALKTYNLFKQAGYDVDLLTKYKVEGYPHFLSVYDCYQRKNTWKFWLSSKLKALYYKTLFRQKKDYYFFYRRETSPPIPVSKILAKIDKHYDIVHVYFWQGMLSFHTVKAIYDKLHCFVRFACADYSVMSGGCHFTGDCVKYKTGCGSCPAIYSNNSHDFTAFNVNYRKSFLKEVKPVISVNNYMKNNFFNKAYLYKNYDRLITATPTIDLSVFHPIDKSILREKYRIPQEKKFILFFGSQGLNDERKGIKYLLEALKIFYNRLNDNQRRSVLLLLAGKNIDEIKERLLFDYKSLGFLSVDKLPQIYSLANVFLSPSVNDAGPLMLLQSMACGTPVIAFEMGYALDFVKGHKTGYCAMLRDSESFAEGIYNIFKLSPDNYKEMSHECLSISNKYFSSKTYIDNYMKVYNEYK